MSGKDEIEAPLLPRAGPFSWLLESQQYQWLLGSSEEIDHRSGHLEGVRLGYPAQLVHHEPDHFQSLPYPPEDYILKTQIKI